MYPEPLIPPDLARLRDQGDARSIVHGRRSTIAEVLERGRLAMLEEDRLEEYRNDPIAYVRARRPRRNLWQRLMHGKARP